jgi:short-subunit dehydrogenase
MDILKVMAGAGVVAAWAGIRRRRRRRQFRGQTVLVTGSSRGLGFLLAREFADRGANIVLCARDLVELERAHEALVDRGATVLSVVCDVSEREQVEGLIEDATEHFGKVDVLVNNAGIIQVGPLKNMKVDDFERAMNSMFYGSLYATLAVLPQMLARAEGRLVNITSIGGVVSVPHLLPYNSAKFATVGLSEGLHAELKKDGIEVTTIVPGLMRTGSFFHALFKGQRTREYGWFSTGSSLPGLTINAERAARKIVDATNEGRAYYVLTPPAKLLAKFHGLFPGATDAVNAFVNRRLMPAATAPDGPAIPGHTVEPAMSAGARRGLKPLTALGRKSAKSYNELRPGL